MTYLQQFFEVIGHILVGLALVQQLSILLDEAFTSTQEESDLPALQIFLRQLSATTKRAQVIGHGCGRVPHDLADFGGRFSLKSQENDLNAVRHHGADVVDGGTQGKRTFGFLFAQGQEIARDGPNRYEENPIGEILAGQKSALAESFLAKIYNSGTTEGFRSGLEKSVVNGSSMNLETDRSFDTIRDRFAGRFIGIDSDKGNDAGRRLVAIRVHKGEIDFFDDIDNGLGFKGRTIEPLL
jgi:hypothetical protein